MSVLKEKRTVSKAEYVNTANQIYVETVGFLTRLSARYSRLIAEGTAQLAGEVMDHTEKANKNTRRTNSAKPSARRICWRRWPPSLRWTCA